MLAEKLLDVLESMAEENIKEFVDAAKYRRLLIKMIEESEQKWRRKYENELYYSRLDGFLSAVNVQNYIVNKSLNVLYDNRTIEYFSSELAQSFVDINREYSNSVNRIAECIMNLFYNIYNKLNQLPAGSEESKMVNILMPKFDKILHEIEILKDNLKSNSTNNALNDDIHIYDVEKEIFNASKREFTESKKEGGRFYSIDIISRLLPNGYVVSSELPIHAKKENGDSLPVEKLFRNSTENVALTGEGGIGKTTFLQKILEETYVSQSGNTDYIPIFIELNRCTSQIAEWYEPEYRKTNFITRTIGQMIENHSSPGNVKQTLLAEIEMEFQRIPENGNPKYLLLLDGFNEVSNEETDQGCSVRRLLSNEISALTRYKNVRIIATTRETQSAYFTAKFKNIFLVGLNEDDIVKHLSNNGFSDVNIGIIQASKELMNCLRIPLFLCMFSQKRGNTSFMPETKGEILYEFFNKHSSSFYNSWRRINEVESTGFTEVQLTVIFDFIIPYIGWRFEEENRFYISKNDFYAYIESAMENMYALFLCVNRNPFEDFEFCKDSLLYAIKSFYNPADGIDTNRIAECICDYIGVCYTYTAYDENNIGYRNYSFIHHYFRDYFSALYNVQILKMLKYINVGIFENNLFSDFMNKAYWNDNKIEFISQITMEHRNRLCVNRSTGNWYMKKSEYPEQCIMISALVFAKKLSADQIKIKHFIYNILSVIIFGRGELSGIDLSDVDLTGFSLFNIRCSKRGRSRTIAADFKRTKLPDECFLPTEHVDSIIEYVYSGNYCFTIDTVGTIKCWDVFSGAPEFTVQSGEPMANFDFSNSGFIRCSEDGKVFAARFHVQRDTIDIGLNIFILINNSIKKLQWTPDEQITKLTYFNFTSDMKYILAVADDRIIYCIDAHNGKTIYRKKLGVPYKYIEIFSDSWDKPLYMLLCNYDMYLSAEQHILWENSDDEVDDNGELTDYDEITEESYECFLAMLDSTSDNFRIIYEFDSSGQGIPIVSYFNKEQCFVLYNYNRGCIERFDLQDNISHIILEELTVEAESIPMSIYKKDDYECYIMYSDVCYTADIRLNAVYNNGIIMKYTPPKLSDTDEDVELNFVTMTCPSKDRLLLTNELHIYEWDIKNEICRLRYNTALYDINDFIYDHLNGINILIHSFNGISVFGGSPIRLINSYCFEYKDYYISNSVYCEKTKMLALNFERPGHEFVDLFSLSNSAEEIIFSTMNRYEHIKSMSFTPEGEYILITTENKVVEYDVIKRKEHTVSECGINEIFVSAEYLDDKIEIAVVERIIDDNNGFEPRVNIYSKVSESKYECNEYYIIPFLEEDKFKEFIHRASDMGDAGGYDKNGIYTYFVTQGFFQEGSNLQVEVYRKVNGELISRVDKLDAYKMIYVKHKAAIDNRYRVGANITTYCYLKEDFSSAVLLNDYEKILWWKDFNKKGSECKMFDYVEENHCGGSVYWDAVVPGIRENTLLCCHNNYRVMEIDIDNKNSVDIEYNPGLSISGCDFRNSDISLDIKTIIKNNGGNV